MTFRFAISVLEEQYDATYRGIKTVREMCSSLTDWITWEGESPDAIYHQFETKVGANTIVSDDQILQLANHYASWQAVHYRLTFSPSYAILTK